MRAIILLLLFSVAISSYVNSQSQPKLLLDGFTFTEGPAIDSDGKLFFSDIPNNRIYVYHDDVLDIFLEESGGANGLYFGKDGTLYACAGKARQLISIDKDGNKEVLVETYDNKKLNSPNDLWIDPQGGIYFTDPRYGNRDNLEQDGMHVYYLSPDRELTRVTDDLVRPNGIIGTSNGKYLYIVDQGVEKTYMYKIDKKDGSLSGKKLYVSFGTDGLSIDNRDNIYLTNGKKIEVYDYDGILVESFSFDVYTTNVVWSKKAIYVTTQAGQVYYIEP